jgi:hypothetical protein
VSDDEGASDDEEESAAAAAAAATTSAEVDDAGIYYAQLENLGVTELRRRLRVERGENTVLSKVSKSDLSTQDLATADSKRSATLELLRRRLATVYAEDDIVLSPTPPTDGMEIE